MTTPAAARTTADERPRLAVLLVDDQRFVGVAIGQLLAAEPDIDLHCCYDAAAAVARANEIRPALILQDLVMPGIDGTTQVGLFRRNPITATTPIVVLSGNDDAEARTQAFAAGANAYLIKLPDRDTLIACVRRHAAGDHTEGALRESEQAGPDESPGETLDPMVLATLSQSLPGDASTFVLNLIDQFLHEAATRVDTLHHAARRLDRDVLRATAHCLKGSALIMGAKRLAALCSRLEEQLERHPAGAVLEVMIAIDEELVQVRAALALQRQDISHSASQDAGITDS